MKIKSGERIRATKEYHENGKLKKETYEQERGIAAEANEEEVSTILSFAANVILGGDVKGAIVSEGIKRLTKKK